MGSQRLANSVTPREASVVQPRAAATRPRRYDQAGMLVEDLCNDQAKVDEVIRLATTLWDSGILALSPWQQRLLPFSILLNSVGRVCKASLREAMQCWWRRCMLLRSVQELPLGAEEERASTFGTLSICSDPDRGSSGAASSYASRVRLLAGRGAESVITRSGPVLLGEELYGLGLCRQDSHASLCSRSARMGRRYQLHSVEDVVIEDETSLLLVEARALRAASAQLAAAATVRCNSVKRGLGSNLLSRDVAALQEQCDQLHLQMQAAAQSVEAEAAASAPFRLVQAEDAGLFAPEAVMQDPAASTMAPGARKLSVEMASLQQQSRHLQSRMQDAVHGLENGVAATPALGLEPAGDAGDATSAVGSIRSEGHSRLRDGSVGGGEVSGGHAVDDIDGGCSEQRGEHHASRRGSLASEVEDDGETEDGRSEQGARRSSMRSSFDSRLSRRRSKPTDTGSYLSGSDGISCLSGRGSESGSQQLPAAHNGVRPSRRGSSSAAESGSQRPSREDPSRLSGRGSSAADTLSPRADLSRVSGRGSSASESGSQRPATSSGSHRPAADD